MIPYMVDKLAPNSTDFTRGLVKYVPGRDFIVPPPPLNGDIVATSPPLIRRTFLLGLSIR